VRRGVFAARGLYVINRDVVGLFRDSHRDGVVAGLDRGGQAGAAPNEQGL